MGPAYWASGQAPTHGEVLESYGELADVPTAMGENFAQMLQSEDAPDPQWVVDAYLKLADLPLEVVLQEQLLVLPGVLTKSTP